MQLPTSSLENSGRVMLCPYSEDILHSKSSSQMNKARLKEKKKTNPWIIFWFLEWMKEEKKRELFRCTILLKPRTLCVGDQPAKKVTQPLLVQSCLPTTTAHQVLVWNTSLDSSLPFQKNLDVYGLWFTTAAQFSWPQLFALSLCKNREIFRWFMLSDFTTPHTNMKSHKIQFYTSVIHQFICLSVNSGRFKVQ